MSVACLCILIIIFIFCCRRLERYWLFGVQNFLTETLSLLHTFLFPMKEDESVTQKKESINMRKRKHREMKHGESSTEKRQPIEIQTSESVYQHYCEAFGRLFFLEKKYV